MARRTSFSLTKGGNLDGGLGGDSVFWRRSGRGWAVPHSHVEEVGKFAATSGFGLPEEPNRRPQIQRLLRKGSAVSFAAGKNFRAPVASNSVGGHDVFNHLRNRRAVG